MNDRGCSIRVEIPATVDAVEAFALEFRSRCPAVCEESAFPAELLLREALMNALEYGCRGDPAKRIFCTIRAKRRRLVIVVRDEGEGFDWRATTRYESALAATSGRGIEIFQKYASRVRFNTKGNAVALMRRF
jgi:anti-sigma regulatory factor (Ser/Thr protein kinase)